MMKKTIWTATVVAMVGLALFLTPGIREAQGKGGSGGHGGGGGGGSGGRSSGGGRASSGGGGVRVGSANYGGRGYAPYRGQGYYGGYYGLGLGLGYFGSYLPGYSYGGLPYATDFGYSGDPRYSFYPDATSQYNYPANVTSQLKNPNDAGFIVRVPDPNAEVWFENYQTQQRGIVRQYESEPLAANYTYTFTVRARWNQNGQSMDQTRQINAQAGQNLVVDFSTPVQEHVPTAPQKQQPLRQ
jgi:uncharacterized protein (TIGR03000 family)